MRADDLAEVALLYDFYGGLLTPKQRQVLDLYYQMDLSLGEIAENSGVSRQAVHDVVRRATLTLRQYERELGLVRRYREQRRQLEALSDELAQLRRDLVDMMDAAGAAAVQPALDRVRRAERIAYGLLQD
ncbi:MAG: YlxM family DNA-binding protein [Clostridia bacterium]|nr:YlxM family DNA-binding protein [Clostridia bacterium]